MKQPARQQEILLMINSSLSRRTFCLKEDPASQIFSAVEQLEEFCWNGNLESFMPGMLEKTDEGKNLFLWHIQQTQSFLHIDLCERPGFDCGEYSIDPYFFLRYRVAS